MNQPSYPINQPPLQTVEQLPVQPVKQRNITKMHIKWLPSENRHQKLVEYEDKTVEEIPFSEEEKVKFVIRSPSTQVVQQNKNPQPISTSLMIQQPIQPLPTNPVVSQLPLSLQPPNMGQSMTQQELMAQKASHVANYNIPHEIPSEQINISTTMFQNCLHFTLLPQGAENSILLFRSKPLQPNPRFTEFSGIINKRDYLLPSMYHNVEPINSIPVEKPAKYEPTMADLKVIKKEEYLVKPMSLDNFSKYEKQAIPTVLASNARIIKRI